MLKNKKIAFLTGMLVILAAVFVMAQLKTLRNTTLLGTTDVWSGVKIDTVKVPNSSPYDLKLANSGHVHLIDTLSQATTIDLPSEEVGLTYEFWYVGGSAEADNHTIDSESDTYYFIGGVSFADTDAGSGSDEINDGVYSDGNSNSKLTLKNLAAGSVVKFICDGTHWYVSGRIYSDTAPAFSDQ